MKVREKFDELAAELGFRLFFSAGSRPTEEQFARCRLSSSMTFFALASYKTSTCTYNTECVAPSRIGRKTERDHKIKHLPQTINLTIRIEIELHEILLHHISYDCRNQIWKMVISGQN